MSEREPDTRLRCPLDDHLLWRDATDGHYHCDKCEGTHRPIGAIPKIARATLRPHSGIATSLKCHQCSATMECLQVEDLEAFVYRCEDCEIYWLTKRGANVLKRRSTQIATGAYFNSLNASDRDLFVEALVDLEPEDSIDDLEARLLGNLKLQIKPDNTRATLVVAPILSLIMLVMMYLPTGGHNVSGAQLGQADTGLYTTLVALFRLPGLFSLVLLFFLMSAVEHRVPRWLHLTGIGSLIFGFLTLGHLGGDSSRVQGGSLFILYAIVLCLCLFPRSRFQTLKSTRRFDFPAWVVGLIALLLQLNELWQQPVIYPIWVSGLSVLVGLATVGIVEFLKLKRQNQPPR